MLVFASFFNQSGARRTNTECIRRCIANFLLLLGLGASCCSYAAVADLVVVVSPQSTAESISTDELSSVFLGKSQILAGGQKVVPIDQTEGKVAREQFYERALKKTPSQLNSYWSRMIFTGKRQPPSSVLDDQEVLDSIATNPDAIGYVKKSSVDDSVKVIMVIK